MRPGPTIFRTARDGFVTSPHRVGVFCRFKHSMSSGLQFSSPRPVTNTSSQDSAVCASGAAASLSAVLLAAELVAALLAPPPPLHTPLPDAPLLPTLEQTPLYAPPHSTF